MSAAQPPPQRRISTAGAGGIGLAVGTLISLLVGPHGPLQWFDGTIAGEFGMAVGVIVPALVEWFGTAGGSGPDHPPRSSIGVGLVLVAIALSGCLSYDGATAGRLSAEYADATELSSAECDAFREAAEALDPEDGRDGPDTTWKGPLGLEDELERAAESTRLLAMTCDRAMDPSTPNVPFTDLARGYSEAWCSILKISTGEGCSDE